MQKDPELEKLNASVERLLELKGQGQAILKVQELLHRSAWPWISRESMQAMLREVLEEALDEAKQL